MQKKTNTQGAISIINHKGFTLIESLVLVVIVAVAVMVFYKTYTLAMRYALDAKHRTAAVEFATEEMEILRNTPYEDIILDPASNPPSGNVISGVTGTGLVYNVARNINDVPHRILREIYYINDPEDGTNDDSEPNDYKKVVITVLWGAGMHNLADTSHKVVLSSFFVPPSGNESAVVNGALSINVVNSNGTVVTGADVTIVHASDESSVSGYTNPLITSSIGNALFLNLEEDVYKVTVTKTNFETIETMASTSTFDPIYVHASILPGVITTLTIITDELPDTTFRTIDPFGNTEDGIDVFFTGGRILGVENSTVPVYVNTNLSASSNASGEMSFDAVSGYEPSIGVYTFQLNEAGYTLWKERDSATCSSFDACDMCVENPSEMRDAFSDTSEVTSGAFSSDVIVINDNIDGIFLTVTDSATNGPFENVAVQIKNDSLGYDYTRETDQYGMVYFPVKNKEDGSEGTACEIVSLQNGESYDIQITTDGYTAHTQSVTVSGLEKIDITLNSL